VFIGVHLWLFLFHFQLENLRGTRGNETFVILRILIDTRNCRVCNVSHAVGILAVESGRVNLAGLLSTIDFYMGQNAPR